MATLITPGNSGGGGSDPSKNSPSQGPALHIDSDWKAQAQAEKERLAQADAERAAKQAAGAGAAGAGAPGEFPQPDMRALIDMLAMQAVMYMGGMADKTSGRAVFDPEYSRHMIDLLAVLEEKTRGNITAEESQDLKLVLNELRMRYVELIKMVAAQQAGAAGRMAGGPAPSVPPGFGGPASIPGISSNV